MKRFIIISILISTLFVFVKSSEAEPITFSYYGVVDTTYCYPDCSPYDAFLGQTIQVTYTFESTTSDSNSSANGDYLDAITDMIVTVGSNTYTANTGDIIITNNDVNPDQYQVYAFLTGPSVGGISNPQFRMIFSDSTYSVYTSDALPTVQPNPSDFNLGRQINLQFVDMTTYPECYGNIISNDIHMGIAPDDNCNGIDENGNGIPDDGYVPTPTSCGVGVCASTGQMICVNGATQNTCNAGTPTGNDDNCNGIDENCNGTSDENYVPTATFCGIGACASTGQLICQNGSIVDTCTPGTPQTEGLAGNPTCSDTLDNDCDGLTDTADPSCQYPDLVIFLSAPTKAFPGESIIVTDTTTNNGAGTALASTTKVYLSKNNKYDKRDIYLGSRAIPVLKAYTYDKGSISVTIPKGTRQGTYFILAVADGDNVVSEANETNNDMSSKITISR